MERSMEGDWYEKKMREVEASIEARPQWMKDLKRYNGLYSRADDPRDDAATTKEVAG
jgi:hypothetical protein